MLGLGHVQVNQLILCFKHLVTCSEGVGKHSPINLYAPRLKVERALCAAVQDDDFAKRPHAMNFNLDAGLGSDLAIISVSLGRG